MKKLFTLLWIVVGHGALGQVDNPILVSPTWLNDHINDPNVVAVQVSFLRLDYDTEHIPGSRFLWPGWLAPDSPEGNMNVPDVKLATDLLRSMGISNDTHVVVCHVRGDVSVAARMLLMLEYLGLKGQVSFLNGGVDAWKKAGYNVTNTPTKVTRKGTFKAAINPVVVDKDYVLKHLDSPTTQIVDARPTRFYDGAPVGYPRDGHIKGAKNIVYQDMAEESNEFKSSEQLEGYFKPVAPKDRELVVYCFIGQTASVVYLAGRVLGYQMKLYDGSMQEWSRIPELPMEMTEKKDEEEK